MDATVFPAISSFIGTLGFPIFVAVWMLSKNSKDSENIATALRDLKEAIVILNARICNKDKE